ALSLSSLFHRSPPPRPLHSFPTRRSSDLTEEHPVVDLSLFRDRNFSTGTVAISLAYAAYFGSIVLLPLWLQQYLGYTATDAGLRSEEHTSELQSLTNIVCRLLL